MGVLWITGERRNLPVENRAAISDNQVTPRETHREKAREPAVKRLTDPPRGNSVARRGETREIRRETITAPSRGTTHR